MVQFRFIPALIYFNFYHNFSVFQYIWTFECFNLIMEFCRLLTPSECQCWICKWMKGNKRISIIENRNEREMHVNSKTISLQNLSSIKLIMSGKEDMCNRIHPLNAVLFQFSFAVNSIVLHARGWAVKIVFN